MLKYTFLRTSGQINMEKDLGEFGGQKCILWRGLNLLMAMFFAMAAYVQVEKI